MAKTFRLRPKKYTENSFVKAGANQHSNITFVKEDTVSDKSLFSKVRDAFAGMFKKEAPVARTVTEVLKEEGFKEEYTVLRKALMKALGETLKAEGDVASSVADNITEFLDGVEKCLPEGATFFDVPSVDAALAGVITKYVEKEFDESFLSDVEKTLNIYEQTASVAETKEADMADKKDEKKVETEVSKNMLGDDSKKCPKCGYMMKEHEEEQKKEPLPEAVQKELDESRIAKEKAEKELADIKEANIQKEFLSRAEDLKAPGATKEEVAGALRLINDKAPAALPIIEKMFKAGGSVAKAAEEITKELGSSASGTPDIEARVNAKANVLIAKDGSMSREQAIDKVLSEDKELYREWMTQK